jgi:hypothetical protein
MEIERAATVEYAQGLGQDVGMWVTGAKLVAVSTWSWPACRGHLDNRRAVPSWFM